MVQMMNELGGSEDPSSFLRSQAGARLEEAKTLSKGSHYARYGLTWFLHRTGADVSADYDDLLGLGIQARKRTGGPPLPSFKRPSGGCRLIGKRPSQSGSLLATTASQMRRRRSATPR
jgi:hypothetical protein